jgi:tetratricopeptide (TPR) repeat protein
VAVLLLIAVTAIWFYLRGFRGPALALAFFSGTLLPALGFFNVYPMRYSFVADHFQYLASVGIIALTVGGLAKYISNRMLLYVAGAAILTFLGVLSGRQCLIYADEETLWKATLFKNPGAWIAHNNLAELLSERGENEKALESLKRALDQTNSKKAANQIRLNIAITLGKLGRYHEALERFQQLQQSSGGMEVRLARTLERLGRDDEAEMFYRRALQGETRSDALLPFGLHLLRRDRPGEAIGWFEMYVQRQPEDADARMFLADSYAIDGRFDDAISMAERALHLARAQGRSRMAELIMKHLEQYRAGKPVKSSE